MLITKTRIPLNLGSLDCCWVIWGDGINGSYGSCVRLRSLWRCGTATCLTAKQREYNAKCFFILHSSLFTFHFLAQYGHPHGSLLRNAVSVVVQCARRVHGLRGQ